MSWKSIKTEKPKIINDNFVRVKVKTERGLVGKCLYGSSGAPGEGIGFSQLISTKCGDVTTGDKIVFWK